MPTPPNRTRIELTPSGRFLLIVLSLSLGATWTTGAEPARLASCLLLAPLLLDWLAKAGRGLDLELSVARRRTTAGALFLERLRVRNRAGRSLWHAVITEQGLAATARGGTVVLEHLPAGRAVELDMPLRTRHRGRAGQRRFAVSTHHPFGLVRARATVTTPAILVSEPARIPIPALPRDDAARGDAWLPTTTESRLDGELFHALRELRDGEDVRGVHALRSSTLATPVRTEYRGRFRIHVRMVVDLRCAPGRRPPRHGHRGFELGLSGAASLLDDLVAREHLLDVLVLAKRPLWFRGVGDEVPVGNVQEVFAAAQPSRFWPLTAELIEELATPPAQPYWIAAGGFSAGHERSRIGDGIRLVEVDDR